MPGILRRRWRGTSRSRPTYCRSLLAKGSGTMSCMPRLPGRSSAWPSPAMSSRVLAPEAAARVAEVVEMHADELGAGVGSLPRGVEGGAAHRLSFEAGDGQPVNLGGSSRGVGGAISGSWHGQPDISHPARRDGVGARLAVAGPGRCVQSRGADAEYPRRSGALSTLLSSGRRQFRRSGGLHTAKQR